MKSKSLFTKLIDGMASFLNTSRENGTKEIGYDGRSIGIEKQKVSSFSSKWLVSFLEMKIT